MRRFLIAGWFLLLTQTSPALELEVFVKPAWGKRLIDNFDRAWPGMRYSSSDVGQTATVKSVSYIRNMLDVNAGFLISPLYRHYFGLNFEVFQSISDGVLSATISNTTTNSTIAVSGYSPAVAYQFCPFAGDKEGGASRFYLGANLGLALANITLAKSSTTGSETISFPNINGPRVQIHAGMKFKAFSSFYWTLEAGVDYIRLADIEGSTGSSNTPVRLEATGSEMAPVATNATDTKFSNFDNIELELRQIYFSVGLAYILKR